MIEQPQAPVKPLAENRMQQTNTAQNNNQQQYATPHGMTNTSSSESSELLREVKQLRQDVQFLKQLLEHVQSQLR